MIGKIKETKVKSTQSAGKNQKKKKRGRLSGENILWG